MSSRALRRSFAALDSLNSQCTRPSASILHSNSTRIFHRAQSTSTSGTTKSPAPVPPSKTATPTTSQSQSSIDRAEAAKKPFPSTPTTPNIAKTGLLDQPLELSPEGYNSANEKVDWTRSFHGISDKPFAREISDVLLEAANPEDVEIKPDGIVYLPEIKYRRILNRAFGPGGWGLVPRGESIVTPKTVTREYALICHGRLVSIARGEQDYFNPDGIPTATEGCKSNALVRCCKDLGVASELWDPRWIRKFKAEYTKEVFVEHVVNKRKSKIWIRKDEDVAYPWKATK
ncbi:Mitochondrial genome maintenance protein MGM101 [Talaromyces atroroseus]|uniref:Mitochondrial genome maintenance protein MGM101 n=1 Tax=Talaromyces atroroseus TaxID=1441469 RepID=A0A225B3W4_TALAT|nr:Mitochondrial genome maintenance protein MGM101 [Talaromyces atroroseus]OKL61976.1 Mitochondrial genome maintenance protein MGM101 [Talaromyces atroroseus]